MSVLCNPMFALVLMLLFQAGSPAQNNRRGSAPGSPDGAQTARVVSKRQPNRADVAYGSHERQRIDFYQAAADRPTPLVLYIHGGGFRGGSKSSLNQKTLQRFLDAGVSVAAIEYRLVPEYPLPTAHRDSLRALQFIRVQAPAWNIDKDRMGAFGGSAGAQLCMWLAFHDEMADAAGQDPLQQESSRLRCVATHGGQTTMDFNWWKQHIPSYTIPHRPRAEYFGDTSGKAFDAIIADISAQSLITADDPPIWMRYGMAPGDPLPIDARKIQGWKVHHVAFGVRLKAMMDDLGIESHLDYPGHRARYPSLEEFMIAKLARP